jgi:GR25 family glycosyltransferase involved in LPS biosynthesis
MYIIVLLLVFIFLLLLFIFSNNQSIKCKSVVINLDKSHDRLLQFIHNYKNTNLYKNIPLYRFRAYDAKLLDIKKYISIEQYKRILYTEEFNQRYYHKDMNKNSIGCFVSHVQVYKQLLRDPDADYYIIFEDDASPTQKYMLQHLLNIIKQNDWDIFLLGGYIFTSSDCKNHHPPCINVKHFFGLQSYIISKQGAKKILQNIYPIDMQIDSKLSKLCQENKISIHSLRSALFNQELVESNIKHPPIKQTPFINPFDL